MEPTHLVSFLITLMLVAVGLGLVVVVIFILKRRWQEKQRENRRPIFAFDINPEKREE